MSSKKTKGEITSLARANKESYSLRTTVPSGIVKQFDLKEGDDIRWEIKAVGNELVVVVTPEKKK